MFLSLSLPYQYVYITGCAILAVFWFLIYLARKDLRREMLWASLWGMPFGLIDYFLVPRYWNPESLFGLIKKFGVGPESFIFFFLMAGIVSVVYEFLWRKKTAKSRVKKHIRYLPFLIGAAVFCLMLFIFPDSAIYALIAGGAAGALATIYLRPDLWPQVIASAFIFSLLYFLVLFLVNQIFFGMVQNFYNLKNTWGILVFGLPLEELAVAFFAGAFWSTFYECAKSYKERRL